MYLSERQIRKYTKNTALGRCIFCLIIWTYVKDKKPNFYRGFKKNEKIIIFSAERVCLTTKILVETDFCFLCLAFSSVFKAKI